jgi:lipid II:glycine glycyltransferase (peptidoglycan interpeptide bridge formation enzyme)
LLRAYGKELKGKTLLTELRNLSDLNSLQPVLGENGFAYEDHLNFLIDLDRPAEEVLQSIGKRTRKKIRKGLRDGHVQVGEATSRSELDHWYDTLQKTYSNVQVPLADRSLFEAAFDVLYPKGMAKFLLAEVDGATAACSVELTYKHTIYGWYGGSDRAYSKFCPNEMLMWHILAWGANNGYRVYDFGGAGKPDEEYGVRDFKAKFGGELVCFGRNTCVHAPMSLRLSRWGYEVYRRFL